MKATLTIWGKTYNANIETGEYTNHTTAVFAVDWEETDHLATLSVNLPDLSEQLPAGAFYGKHWSENEGLLEQLVEQGIIVPVPEVRMASSGFVSGIRAYRMKN